MALFETEAEAITREFDELGVDEATVTKNSKFSARSNIKSVAAVSNKSRKIKAVNKVMRMP